MYANLEKYCYECWTTGGRLVLPIMILNMLFPFPIIPALFFFQFSASTLIPMEMLKHNFMIALCSHNHTCYTMKNIETCMFIQQPATKYKDDAHVKRAGRSFVVIKINKTYKFYFEFC